MPSPFSVLQRTPTKEQLLLSLVAILKGIGLTTHTGFSPGTVTITGVPVADGVLLIQIVSGGDLGGATEKYSLDGGATWSSPATIPTDGIVSITGATNLSMLFTAAPTGLTSFIAGDVFTVPFNIPTWPLNTWDEGQAGRTVLELDATVLEDVYALIFDMSSGGFVSTALAANLSDWIDLLASDVFALTRIPGTVTQGQVFFSDPTGVGPFTLASGDVVLQSDEGLNFILSEDITVPASSGISALVRAEAKGSKYNVGDNTINSVVTSVPGLLVQNPAFSLGTWITTAGGDDESDQALVLRCLAQWQTLAVGLPTSMYDTWSKAADAAVNRSFSRVSPSVAGQVDLFVAGPAGAVSGGVVSNVQAYVDQRTALTNTVVVASVSNHAQSIAGTVNITQAFLVSAKAAVLQALDALLDVKKGIGATLYFSEVWAAIQNVPGVRNVELTSPTGDVVLAANEIFVFTNNLTFVGV